MRQLLLDLPVGGDFSAAAWLSTRGTAEAEAVLGLAGAEPAPLVGLYGAEGVGKTHLLAMVAVRFPRTLLVDDLEALGRDEQELVFHEFNARGGKGLVVASRVPVAQLDLLKDLKSRLLTGLQVEVRGPDEAELRQLVARWAAVRQLGMPEEVIDYVILRAERNPKVLLGLMGRLDALSLENKRKITVPLARGVLEGE